MARPETVAIPVRAEIAAVPGRDAVSASVPTAATNGSARAARGPRGRVQRVLVAVAVGLLAALGVAVAFASFDRLGGFASPASDGVPATEGADPSSPSGTAASPPAGSANGIPPATSATVVGFDVEPLGPLSPDAEGIAAVLGRPEVVALPSPFNRSVRLGSAGAGFCIDPPSRDGSTTVEFSVRTGTQPDGRLRVVPPDEADRAVALHFGEIDALQPETWYSIHLSWDGTDDGLLEVHEAGGGRLVFAAAPADSEPRADDQVGSVCIEALEASESTAVHVDEARVTS